MIRGRIRGPGEKKAGGLRFNVFPLRNDGKVTARAKRKKSRRDPGPRNRRQ